MKPAVAFILALPCCVPPCYADEPALSWSVLREGENLPLSKVTQDARPPFKIDRDVPFRIEFGRGSGWEGLDVIKVAQDGRVIVYRMKSERHEGDLLQKPGVLVYEERAALTIPPKAVGEILKAVDDNGLLGLHKEYQADENVEDGTQWVLWIRQDKSEKCIYFNNHFPEAILRFAKAIDVVLDAHGLAKVAWHRVPDENGRNHEDALWAAVDRYLGDD